MTPVANQIFVLGSGGHGSEVCSYLQFLQESTGEIELLGAIDDNKPKGKWNQTAILGNLLDLKDYVENHPSTVFGYITAVGDNQTRREIVLRLEGLKISNLIPYTLKAGGNPLHCSNKIGAGTLLAPGSILTTNVDIGSHCILNIKASVSHDCVVHDFVNLNPGVTVAGCCVLGEGSYVGAGATILNKIRIGRGAIVGAGAVVTKDVPDFATVVGVPARVIKFGASDVPTPIDLSVVRGKR